MQLHQPPPNPCSSITLHPHLAAALSGLAARQSDIGHDPHHSPHPKPDLMHQTPSPQQFPQRQAWQPRARAGHCSAYIPLCKPGRQRCRPRPTPHLNVPLTLTPQLHVPLTPTPHLHVPLIPTPHRNVQRRAIWQQPCGWLGTRLRVPPTRTLTKIHHYCDRTISVQPFGSGRVAGWVRLKVTPTKPHTIADPDRCISVQPSGSHVSGLGMSGSDTDQPNPIPNPTT